jgi:hypothetical protein
MKFKLIPLLIILSCPGVVDAQIVLLNTYNPPTLGQFCGVGYDAVQDRVWAYECFGDSVHCLSAAGAILYAVDVPGGTANDVDVETLPASMIINGTTYPSGQL